MGDNGSWIMRKRSNAILQTPDIHQCNHNKRQQFSCHFFTVVNATYSGLQKLAFLGQSWVSSRACNRQGERDAFYFYFLKFWSNWLCNENIIFFVFVKKRAAFVKRRSRVLRRRTRQAALDKPRVHDGQLGFAILEQKAAETAENRAFEEKQPLVFLPKSRFMVV